MRSLSPSPGSTKASPDWRIGIVYSSFYPEIIGAMRESALQELRNSGIPKDHISLHEAPGSFEIPLIGRNLVEKKSVDALIALGVIVQGDTHHAEILARESARGCMEVQLTYGIPFGYEILYVDRLEDAEKRGEKGAEAARAVLAVLREKLRMEN
ncbi:MAG: 6,7-dimethyl-8-ribityllumazine synthase [Candidatus Peregrinibacteria bacterium Greene0416_62]|nr:MAG: 6,7-dimethyl-8-ribityllumazine synthase [Candidatus Peregrinibacteria bacterium Greene0416_62]TSC99004.1 MAG: 6,7-dimethyl-8-ribityllumazine synthase [Candidatus Peregrinibacteria bacterium Greene1014_49]